MPYNGSSGDAKMPNESGSKKVPKGMGSNTGSSTGLRHEEQKRADVMKAPNNKNQFPNGLA